MSPGIGFIPPRDGEYGNDYGEQPRNLEAPQNGKKGDWLKIALGIGLGAGGVVGFMALLHALSRV